MEFDTKQPQQPKTPTTTTTGGGELFICFSTSCLSKPNSSSMRISKKTNTPASLTASLSRRLRANAGGDGGQSPMFTSGVVVGKKRGGGGGFENPEPSSPKVTCIGQVRVKTKKQSKKIKMMRASRSRRQRGETSFRRVDQHGHEVLTPHHSSQQMHPDCLPHRNQRWVHLPFSICEAMRSFGSEISCFLPCKPPCIAEGTSREKVDHIQQHGGNMTGSGVSCGAAVCRWFVSMQDEDEGRRRDIELMVGGDDEGEVKGRRGGVSRRRSIFDGIEFKDGDEGRVSICIPPKNALLLMRCRSDPEQMEALSKRFWKPSLYQDYGVDGDEEDDDEEIKATNECETKGEGSESWRESEIRVDEMRADLALEMRGLDEAELVECVKNFAELEHEQIDEEELEYAESRDSQLGGEDEDVKITRLIEAEIISIGFSIQGLEDEENPPNSVEDAENQPPDIHQCSSMANSDSERNEQAVGEARHSPVEARENFSILDLPLMGERVGDENILIEKVEGQETTRIRSRGDQIVINEERKLEKPRNSLKRESNSKGDEDEKEAMLIINQQKQEQQQERSESSSMLPDCLLLMMCEPKLSMEVSKETWICSTDFLRWLPERHHRRKAIKPTGSSNEPKKKKPSIESNPVPPPPAPALQPGYQPPRSSCSFPVVSSNAGEGCLSMASMIEQKLANAAPYEPLVLTRCKSEPMRSAAKFGHQEIACFWRNRKLEPHRPTAFGVNAAGIGC
ncbi:hypothetical protein AKJ16_DCAP08425 [Drosera capensis]